MRKDCDMYSRVRYYLDVVATVSLCISVVVVVVMFADMILPPGGTTGTHPNNLERSVKATILLGLLCAPAIFCAILWPNYLRQKRLGAETFGWLRFVVLASALWTYFVYEAINNR